MVRVRLVIDSPARNCQRDRDRNDQADERSNCGSGEAGQSTRGSVVGWGGSAPDEPGDRERANDDTGVSVFVVLADTPDFSALEAVFSTTVERVAEEIVVGGAGEVAGHGFAA